ncbi:hypothetical protein [Azohydromonas aeria]|uniref:hypothetical protein n=1 Tax=Azohydromonas aeria TaxID=2590212 RepID=UPI0012F929E3|nr:hypothetical protein [Azohydromonas aeria]
MTMATTKANLLDLLADGDIKVTALAGKWGTGKSHMWRKIQQEAEDSALADALYVSLFGVATILDLKLRLAQSAVPLGNSKGPAMDAAISAINGAKKIATSLFKGASALDELALLAVPALVRSKFIVVDDIERKHSKLSIDEVLGFIDDFTQNYGCRFLLVLNTDQLVEKKIWEQFREKVIDQELRLETTSAEAFDIAIQLTPSKFSGYIKTAVEACGITNIRIIRKIIRATNRILMGRDSLPHGVVNRLIPSAVLLSAIHYKGMDNGPSIDFVLSSGSIMAGVETYERRKEGRETDEDRLQAEWELLMQKLGIYGADEYESLIADYLRSGLFDRSKLDTTINKYLADTRLDDTKRRAYSFAQACIFRPDLTEKQLLEVAESLLPDICLLSPTDITALHYHVSSLEGGDVLGSRMIDAWIGHLLELSKNEGVNPDSFVLDDFFGETVHPDIANAYKQAHNSLIKTRSLLDVCLWMVERNGYSSEDETVMRAATIDDFEKTILSITSEPLKTFMLKNIDIYKKRHTNFERFGSASVNFIEACKRILQNPPNRRWEKLIKDLFKNRGIELYLNEDDSKSATS